ncbi:protein of unknown function (plasmid) [Azospirillum lipoferum 4B]|uniref:Uncharacterized protein n=1 Tax=Azospirillum lipoferum (strain 4B) TaxID=862719 RepID=G7ZD61_AZOL4|nr:protein of unknown function [Azospirillum lipoferum 4B]
MVAPATPAQPQTGWNGDIVVINAYNSAPSGTQQGYEQTLALLPFTGGNTLAPSATDSITLDQVLNGVPMSIYDLLIAQANNLFPVQVVSEMMSFTTFDYQAITVEPSAANADPFIGAWQFYQIITADPSCNLATGFTAACNSASSSAAQSSDVDSTVNQFFKGTQSYQNVTFASYVAVSTYLTSFAAPWANFQNSYTYYLYVSGGEGTEAKAYGSVAFVLNQASGLPSPTDPSSGYTITYTDTSGNTTPLYFSKGQLVSSTTQDNPPICLQMAYSPLSTFTGQSSDYNTIMPMTSGIVNGQQVVGVNEQQSDWQDFLNFLGTVLNNQYVQLFVQITGVAMGIKTVVDGVAWLKGKLASTQAANKGTPPTQEQVSEIKGQLPEVQQGIQTELQTKLNDVGSGGTVPAPSAMPEAQTNLQSQMVQNNTEDQITEVKDGIAKEQTELQDDAEVSVNTGVETDASNLRQVAGDVNSLSPTDPQAPQKLAADETSLSNIQTDLTKQNEQDSAGMASNEKATVQAAEEEEETEEEEEKEENTEDSDLEDGEFGEDVEDVFR